MDARRIMRTRHAGGFSHMALLAGICALAISASPALAYWQDAGGALGGTPKTQKPKTQDPKSDVAKKKDAAAKKNADKKKDADQAKEDVIRSIDQLLGKPSPGTPGAKKGPIKPKAPVRRTSPKAAEDVPAPAETVEPPKEEEEIILPPAKRTYRFAIKDGTFEQLLDAWSRQTGLGVIGKPPSGKVTFVSDETLTFREALNRIRTLLFKQEELAEQWLIYDEDEGFFEVKPVNEMRRYIPADRRFASIEAFLKADMDPEELVYVIYRPKRAVAALQNVMDHMPLYVLIAPYANSNTQTILALAKDVHKYLDLVDFLGGAPKDPRTIVRMKLQYITPSVAIEKLHNLMDLDVAGASSSKPKGRRGRIAKDSIVDIPEPAVSLLPDDALGIILVRAMQDKIDEIELLLPYIDVDSASGHPVVVVKVEHADVNALVGTIQTILQASAGKDGAGARRGSTRKRTPKASGKSSGFSSAPVSADDITLIPLPAMSQIIVLADEAGVERVRKLVQQFDVEVDVRHRFALRHATPEEAIARIPALANFGDSGVQLIADPRGHAVWFVGPASMLSKVEEVLPDVDVAGEMIELYSYSPVNQAPSFLANMLREYQSGQTAGKRLSKPLKQSKRKSGGRRLATPVVAGRFTPDDEADVLWVWCTQADWDEFLPLIQQLDEMAPKEPRITRIRPEHIDPSEAINLLTKLAPMSDVGLLSTPDGILVTGASEAQLAEINAIMEQIDRADNRAQRTFTLEHADPQDMIQLLQGVVGASSASKSTSPRRGVKKGKKVGRGVSSSSSDDLDIHAYGRQLIVSATEPMMAEVEKIIEQFDVKQIVTETRTYPFPPGTNLANIVGQLQGWLTVDRPKGASVPVIIPRPGSHVVVVIAEPSQFPKIEELIDVIDDEPDVPRRITDYIAVEHVSASVLIEMIEPLLQISIRKLIVEGVLPPGGQAGPPDLQKRGKRRPVPGGEAESTSGQLTMMPDDRNHRIVIVAPEEIIAEARELVAKFDLEGSGPVHRRIALRRAEAAAVVVAVKELMGQATGGRKGRSITRRTTDGATSDESVSFIIVEAPGGGAVFVRGMPQDVEDAENWIDELDSEASGKKIKLFTFSRVSDIKGVADVIMNALEAPKPQSPAARARGSRSARQEESADSVDSWETTFTRIGSDIYLKGDEIAGTMLAVASPAKMTQIADIIEQFEPSDGSEGDIPSPDSQSVPWMTYELQNVDAVVGALNLDMYLDALWRPRNKVPKVDYSFFGDMLVIEYPDDSRFDEIRQIIADKIDIVDPDDLLLKTLNINLPKGIDPRSAALWLQMHYPDVQIEVEEVEREVDWEELVPRVRPAPVKRVSSGCALPMSYQRAIDGLVTLAAVQDPPAEESDDAPASETSESPRRDPPGSGLRNFIDPDRPRRSSQGGLKRTLRAIADPVRRTLSVRGQDRDVRKIEDLLDRMKEELGNAEESARPDIRVYRVRYISVYEAAEIIDEVFNATRREAQQLRQQQQAAARAAQQKANQARRAAQAKGGQPGSQPKVQQPPANVPAVQMPQMPGGVRIVPNPRDRTLIMKANTSDYPAILELLATIDQPQPINKAHRTFQLERLNAEEVTAQLKEMLGLDVRVRKAKSSGTKSQGRSGGGGLPETIMQQTITGADALGLNAEDITLMANPAANTIFAMAPVAALDYIEQLISAMEAHEAPERETRHFELVYADAASTAEYLSNYFNGGGKKGQRIPAVSPFATPTFLPYPELNLVTVQAGEEQMAKVKELIAQVDVQRESEQFKSITVSTDAKTVADLLGQMYSGGGGRNKRGDANAPAFIGEDGGNILFYSAPEALQEEILTRIGEIEQQANVRTKPRIINLQFAKPSDIATAIEAAYGVQSRGRRSASLFTITAHDPSKRLFVTKADDAMFAEIESLALLLDKPADMGFEFRIYPFQHVKARKVHELLTKLVKDYIARSRGGAGIEPFSAEVDDKSNALVVMGSPTVHEFLSKNIAIMDSPMNAESPPGFMIVSLKNADAVEVAQNINRLFGNAKTLPPGETPAQAEANRTLNTVMIRGSEDQLAKIRKDVIDPLEDYKPEGLETEIIKLVYAQPEAVAESINRIFEDRQNALKKIRRGNVSPIENTVVVTPDVDTGQIIVQASAKNMELILSRVAELDRADVAASGATILKTYPIKYANPGTVANIITQWSRSRTMSGGRNRSLGARDVVIALAENDTQSVVVTASESNHKIIKELLDALDNEENATRRRKQHLIKIQHANAVEVAGRLTQLARSVRRKRGDSGAVFVGDPVSNTIIAQVNDEELDQLEKLLAAIDVEPDASAQRITTPYPLKYADPGSINGVLMNLFRHDRGSQPSPSERVTSAVDWGTRSVIVTASEKNHALVSEILRQVDKESSFKKELHTYPLEHAEAQQVAQSLTAVYRGRRSTGRGEQPVQITADAASNQLLIMANETEMEELESLIQSLDVEPAEAHERTIRNFKLIYAEPWGVQNAINSMFRGMSRNPRDRVTAVPEWGSNSVIVSASKQKMKQVEELIKQFETGDSNQREIRVVTVEHADPSAVAQSLNQVFVSRGRGFFGGGGAPPISISAIQGSKSILIKAGGADMTRILDTLEKLDTDSFAVGGEIRVIPLLKSDVSEVLTVMQEYLRKPGSGRRRRGGGGDLAGDVRLSALTDGNAIVVSGGKDEVDRIEAIIKSIDDEGEMGRAPKVIRLEHADAVQLLPTLEQMFAEQRGGRGGRGASQQPPVIVANETLNALLVRAGAADFNAIQDIVKLLDTEEASMGSPIKIISVAPGVNVVDLASMIEESINATIDSRGGSQRGGRGRRERISITADSRTHSILVAGASAYFNEVERLVKQLQGMGHTGQKHTAIIRTVNLKAEEVRDLIERLKEENQGSRGSSRRGSSRGGSRRRR